MEFDFTNPLNCYWKVMKFYTLLWEESKYLCEN